MNRKRIRTAAAVLGTAAVAGVAGCGGQAATTQSSTAATSPAQTGQQTGQPPSSGDMAAALAEELGISEAKVQAALDKVMPAGGPSVSPPTGTQNPSQGSSGTGSATTTESS